MTKTTDEAIPEPPRPLTKADMPVLKSITEWAAEKKTPDFMVAALVAYHAFAGKHGPAWWPQGHEQDASAKFLTEAQYDAALCRADG